MDSLGLLPQVGKSDAWNWVFFGAGTCALLILIGFAFSPDQPTPDAGSFIWPAVMLILGLGGLVGVGITFPLVLLLMGTTLLVATLLRCRPSL